jgi:hypothetical protein
LGAQVKNAPTPEQLVEFDAYLKKWQILLGMNDWRVYRSPKRPAKTAAADVESDVAAKMARVRVGDFGEAPITPHELEDTALHELLHSFLAELVHVSKTSKDWTLRMNAEHRIIHTLVRLLVPADKP